MKEWYGTNAVNPTPASSFTFEKMLQTISDLKAQLPCYDPSIRCGDKAMERLANLLRRKGSVVGEAAAGNPLFRVPVKMDPLVPRGFAYTQDGKGQVICIDLRTDAEKAEDAARFPKPGGG